MNLYKLKQDKKDYFLSIIPTESGLNLSCKNFKGQIYSKEYSLENIKSKDQLFSKAETNLDIIEIFHNILQKEKVRVVEESGSIKILFFISSENRHIKIVLNKEEDNNSQNEINNLRNQLSNANKIINEQQLKIQELQKKLNNCNNTINNLNNKITNYQNIINQKDLELNNLRTQLSKNISNDINILNNSNVNFGDVMCVNFISEDQQVHYAITCLKQNTFAEVEEKLYKKFPIYRNTNNNFIANDNIVLRFKTIEENQIGNGLPVTLIVPS